MFDDFMEALTSFLVAASQVKKGGFIGCPESEIVLRESRLGISLPASYRAFLLRMGRRGGCFASVHLSLDALDESLEVAERILPSELMAGVLPICQNQGYSMLLLRLDQGGDPAVFSYAEPSTQLKQSYPTFTAMLREQALLTVEYEPWNNEVCREIRQHRDEWLDRKAILDDNEAAVDKIRAQLIATVAEQDAERGRVTTPLHFQRLWVEEFRDTDIFRKLQSQARRIPWGWTSLDDVK